MPPQLKVDDRDTFRDHNGREISYAAVRAAMDEDTYPMSLVGDALRVVVKAIAQGIDSHLEACFVPDRGDRTTLPTVGGRVLDDREVHVVAPGPVSHRARFRFSRESMPVLLRRLSEDMEYTGEDGDDADVGGSFAADILGTLGLGD